MNATNTVGQVVGENLLRIRTKHRQTQPEAATYLRARGLPWTRSHIASLESGRRESVALEALVLLSWAYEVPVWEWFAGEGDVRLSEGSWIERGQLREAIAGGDIIMGVSGYMTSEVAALLQADEADFSAARNLDVTPGEVANAAHRLYGHTLTQERDTRLGDLSDVSERSRRSRRGRMTLRLAREIEPHVRREESD